MTCISSTRNRRIQHALKLRQSSQRRLRGHTLIEGKREIACALRAQIPFHTVFVCTELMTQHLDRELEIQLRNYAFASNVPVFEITRPVHERLAMRGSTGGIVVEAIYSPSSLPSLPQPPDARYVVLEDADRPGNVGAVLRTAAATGMTGLILARHRAHGTDLANPNVIRASLGALFEIPTAQDNNTAVLSWLRSQQCAIIACDPTGQYLYSPVNVPSPAAFVFGSEAQGLSEMWRKSAHATLAIPMVNSADSLNLSVSVAVVLYEFLRRSRSSDTEPASSF